MSRDSHPISTLMVELQERRITIAMLRNDLIRNTAYRDRLIVQLSAKGMSRRGVALLAGVTMGRVQQILMVRAPELIGKKKPF